MTSGPITEEKKPPPRRAHVYPFRDGLLVIWVPRVAEEQLATTEAAHWVHANHGETPPDPSLLTVDRPTIHLLAKVCRKALDVEKNRSPEDDPYFAGANGLAASTTSDEQVYLLDCLNAARRIEAIELGFASDSSDEFDTYGEAIAACANEAEAQELVAGWKHDRLANLLYHACKVAVAGLQMIEEIDDVSSEG